MPSVFFVFGPDQSWFFNGPSGWKYNNIPKSLEERLVPGLGNDKRIRKLYCLGLASSGEWSAAFKRWDNTNSLMYPSDVGYSGLMNWMTGAKHANTGKPCAKPAAASLQMTFGPTSAFFACDPSQGSRWEHPVPAEMDALVKKKAPPAEGVSWRQNAKNPRVNPVLGALGVKNAYFVLWPNGTFDYNLDGQYDELDEILKNSAPGSISYLSLNPYVGGQYFVAFHDRKVSYCMPQNWSSQFQSEVLNWQTEAETIVTSTTLSHGRVISAQAKPANPAGVAHEAPPAYSAGKPSIFGKIRRLFSFKARRDRRRPIVVLEAPSRENQDETNLISEISLQEALLDQMVKPPKEG